MCFLSSLSHTPWLSLFVERSLHVLYKMLQLGNNVITGLLTEPTEGPRSHKPIKATKQRLKCLQQDAEQLICSKPGIQLR